MACNRCGAPRPVEGANLERAPPSTAIAIKKIFVGGLHPDVTDGDFKKYFEKYGSIVDSIVMFDKHTKRSRGFGFVTFETADAVDKCCSESQHEIKGKFVEVKKAEARSSRSRMPSGPYGRGGHPGYGGGGDGGYNGYYGGGPGPGPMGGFGDGMGYGGMEYGGMGPGGYGMGYPQPNAQANYQVKDGDWPCPSCGNINFARRRNCNRCGTRRPDADMLGPPDGGHGGNNIPMRDGDWICDSCGNHNFARRTECNRCKAPRPKQDADAARTDDRGGGNFRMKPPPPSLVGNSNGAGRNNAPPLPHAQANFQMKPGDWACPSCGNLNFARRTKCNRCDTPRPEDDGGYQQPGYQYPSDHDGYGHERRHPPPHGDYGHERSHPPPHGGGYERAPYQQPPMHHVSGPPPGPGPAYGSYR